MIAEELNETTKAIARENIKLRQISAELLSVMYSIRDICGGDIATHFSESFAKKFHKVLKNSEKVI